MHQGEGKKAPAGAFLPSGVRVRPKFSFAMKASA
jgi:hypothetical protein